MGSAPQAPQAANLRLDDSIQALPGAALLCDGDFRITAANAAACDMLRSTIRDLTGKPLASMAGALFTDGAFDPSAHSNPETPHQLTRPDGSAFSAQLSFAAAGANWIIQLSDVSALVEKQGKLLYRVNTWRYALEAAGHGVWDYNAICDKRFYSVGWKRMRGLPDDAVVDDTLEAWEARVHPDDLEHVRRNVDDHNSGRVRLFSFHYRERRADGSWMWVSSRGQAIDWDANGVPTRFTGTDTDVTELMQTVQAVDALQRRHELALSASGVGVWEIDAVAQTFSCDDVLAEMFDFPTEAREDLPLTLWKQALHPDDAEETSQKAFEAISNGTGLEQTFRIVRRNGDVRHIATSCVFYRTPEGKPRFLGADRDITESRQREADLSAQSLRFEAAIKNMGHGLAMYDAEGRLTVANQAYADMYGFPDHLMVSGTPAEELVKFLKAAKTMDLEILETAKNDALSAGTQSRSFERTWRLSNGRIVSYSTRSFAGGGWLSIHRDITEKHLAERQLAESEERFRDFTGTASDWCWETDAELRVTYLTESFAASTGLAPDAVIGKSPFDVPVHPDDLATVKALFEPTGGAPQPFKDVLLRLQTPDGRLGYNLVSGLPRFDDEGTLIGYRGTGTNVTAAEERKIQLAEAEALLSSRTAQLVEAQRIGKMGDWSFDLGADHLWWAPEVYALLGHDPQTFTPTYEAVMAVYVGDSGGRVLAAQSEVVRTGRIKSVDVKARRADGSIGDFVVTSKARVDECDRVIGFYGTIQDISDRKIAEEQLERLAYFDPLTGLANRALFQREVDKVLRRSKRDGSRGALMLLDLDRFKEVNDSLGHVSGDELLARVGRLLSGTINQSHFLARLGGDEFAVVVPQAERHELETLASRLTNTLSGPMTLERGEVTVSTSIGVAVIPEDGSNLTDLMRHADLALYQAKDKGRDRFEFFRSELNESVQNKMALSRDLRTAITENVGLAVQYQPQVSLKTGRVTGFEALMRWDHPERGPISPTEFIPIAESSHLICDLGLWVLRSAATQAVAWLAAGEPPRKVAVNVSAAQIWHSDLVSDVKQILAETGLHPSLLCLELTETLLADHADGRGRKVLNDLNDLGVTLALDDFGTGYSSLGYLKQLPFRKLKIDRVFVDHADASARARELLKGIVALGRGLSMTVVAEGAERQEELDLLAEIGCDLAQGYVCARPSLAPQALAFAQDREGQADARTWQADDEDPLRAAS